MVLKTLRLSLAGLLVMAACTSCSLLEPGLSVLRGNYLYQQGRYQDALLKYLEGEDSGKFQNRILYNVGNVYYALGEGPSALELWQGIQAVNDPDVVFSTLFNSGVIFYQQGRYGDAFSAFKAVLELQPANLDAKRNLELTLDRMEADSRSGENKSEKRVSEESDDARRILQYIQRKEGAVWQSTPEKSEAENDW